MPPQPSWRLFSPLSWLRNRRWKAGQEPCPSAKNHTCCQGDAPLSGIDYTKLPWPIYFLIQGEDWDGTNAMFMILTVALVSRILLTDVMELCPWRSGACKHLVGEGVSMPVSSGCCWGFPSPPVNRVSLAFFESYRNV